MDWSDNVLLQAIRVVEQELMHANLERAGSPWTSLGKVCSTQICCVYRSLQALRLEQPRPQGGMPVFCRSTNAKKMNGPKTIGATAAIHAAFEKHGVRFEISDTEATAAQRPDGAGNSSNRR